MALPHCAKTDTGTRGRNVDTHTDTGAKERDGSEAGFRHAGSWAATAQGEPDLGGVHRLPDHNSQSPPKYKYIYINLPDFLHQEIVIKKRKKFSLKKKLVKPGTVLGPESINDELDEHKPSLLIPSGPNRDRKSTQPTPHMWQSQCHKG